MITGIESIRLTKLDASEADQDLLQGLQQRLLHVASSVPLDICQSPPFIVHGHSNMLAHRVIMYRRPEQLLHGAEAFVGFIGKRQAHVTGPLTAAIDGVDDQMMDHAIGQSLLLGYASQQLLDGNWANLVVFRHQQGAAQVTQSSAHRYAAQTLAPQYYAWIRLHHGVFPAGLPHGDMTITATKTYAFPPDHGGSF